MNRVLVGNKPNMPSLFFGALFRVAFDSIDFELESQELLGAQRMTEYKSKKTAIAVSLSITTALLATILGMSAALIHLGAANQKPMLFWVLRWLTPFVCALLIPAFVRILRSFRSYRVDEESITRKGMFTETTLKWDEAVDYEATAGVLSLKDSSGREIWMSGSEPHFAKIADEFDQRRPAIKARQFAIWKEKGVKIFFDYRFIASLSLLIVPSALMIFDLCSRHFSDESLVIAFVIALMLPIAPLFLAISAFFKCPLYVRMYPNSFETWFLYKGKIKFNFDEIVSILVGNIGKGMSTRILLKDGTRLSLTNGMMNRELISEYLRGRVDEETQKRGRQEFVAEKDRFYRRFHSFSMGAVIASLFLSLVAYSIPIGMRLQSTDKLHKNSLRMQQFGVRRIGRVTKLEVDKTDASARRNLVGFEFEASGVKLSGESFVSAQTLRSFKQGGPIPILYLRENPNTHMAEASISAQVASEKMSGAYVPMLIPIGFLCFILIPMAFSKKRSPTLILIPQNAVHLDPENFLKILKKLKRQLKQVQLSSRLTNISVRFFFFVIISIFLAGATYYAFHPSSVKGNSNQGETQALIAICILFFATILGVVVLPALQTSRDKRFVNRHFADLFDPRLMPDILSMVSCCDTFSSSSAYDDHNKILMLAMAPGISVLTQEQASRISERDRKSLHKLFAASENNGELESFTLAFLKSTPLFGDRATLQQVRSLSRDSNIASVLDEARRVLPILEARINNLRQGEKQELLSPASAPTDKALLIPHVGQFEIYSQDLLIPVSKTNFDVEIKPDYLPARSTVEESPVVQSVKSGNHP